MPLFKSDRQRKAVMAKMREGRVKSSINPRMISIFKKRRQEFKKKVKAGKVGVISAFAEGIEVGRKIDQDLFKLNKVELMKQKRLAKGQDKISVQRVINAKFGRSR